MTVFTVVGAFILLVGLIAVLRYRQKTKPPSLHLAAGSDKKNDKKKK